MCVCVCVCVCVYRMAWSAAAVNSSYYVTHKWQQNARTHTCIYTQWIPGLLLWCILRKPKVQFSVPVEYRAVSHNFCLTGVAVNPTTKVARNIGSAFSRWVC